MIVCQNVMKRFGQKEVLKGMDFSIKKGQIFGLLGPSGAGKTTLIKILTDQLGFDGGSIRVLGKEVGSLTGEDKKKIGIMMDQFGVYERLSCADNLKPFADIYGIDHKKVKEILDQVGLSEAYNRPAMNLSKGMRARLQLARVFMHSPKIIFLDEPTSGLDPQSMRAIHQIILKKKEEGCTIFLTTHNMEEATKLCDQVALLHEGVIVDHGEPKELCRKYNHQKKIILHLTDGKDVELSHTVESTQELNTLFSEGLVETIHSSEPTLETVFLELTGKKLEEEV